MSQPSQRINTSRIAEELLATRDIDVPSSKRLLFRRESIRGEAFSGQSPTLFMVEESRFEDCEFDRLTLGDGEFKPQFGAGRRPSEYVDCCFDNSRIIGATGFARFLRCSFRGVSLIGWGNCREMAFDRCTFSGDAYDVTFYGKRERLAGMGGGILGRRLGFAPNTFGGNDFSEVNLRQVGFRMGIDLRKQQLPDAEDYVVLWDTQALLGEARERICGWDEKSDREEALGPFGLPLLADHAADGQTQWFFRMSETREMSRGIGRMFSLLSQLQAERV